MGLIHRQQIAEPAAVRLSPLFPRQRHPTKRAFLRRQFLRRMRLVILLPPFHPARIAAIFPRNPRFPFRLELLPAVRTYLLRPRPASTLCQQLLVVIPHPALVAAEPPPSPCPAFLLLHHIPAFRANVYLPFVVPLCVVVPVPALIAAVFLPRDMARWNKSFSTILTL